ncbi:Aste57867_23983 [Aphanomyces stellatus]|uniref:Aste57867_23983 protein n=1 Tax=Aphanomyces stellatus TaxID=120398 RepID=A0A485LQT3_9STRA|nr:hypothetical protein As57867_023910 [Aphanomyces stellatus]VFU00626.1 Aste57867_23983 [Aphanomyces stellatus]
MAKFPVHITSAHKYEVHPPPNNDQDNIPTHHQHRVSLVVKPHPPSHNHIASDDAMTRLQTLESAAGFVYVAASIAASCMYVALLLPSLANDMWWPRFNASGTHVFLGDVVNFRVGLTPSTAHIDAVTLSLIDPSMAFVQSYGLPTTTIELTPVYARRLVLQATTDLEDIVRALHAGLDDDSNDNDPWVFQLPVQYCYVDFDQRFELARSSRRQARCAASYRSNAAVYLEPILRNVDATQWDDRPTHGPFCTALLAGVLDDGGASWLDATQHAFVDVVTEASHWRAKNVTQWQLQWHNQWLPRVDESIAVQNVLWLHVNLAVKTMPFAPTATWTSGVLHVDFWSMLQAADRNASSSLVRTSTRYIGDATIDVISDKLELSVVRRVWTAKVGPFGTIDAYWVSRPPSLAHAVVAYRTALLSFVQANAAALDSFQRIGSCATVNPSPHSWTPATHVERVFYGGSPLCVDHAVDGSMDPQASFGFDDSCMDMTALTVDLRPNNLVFAFLATLATTTTTTSSLTERVAAITQILCTASNVGCAESLSRAATLAMQLHPIDFDLDPVVRDVAAVSVVQVAQDRQAPSPSPASSFSHTDAASDDIWLHTPLISSMDDVTWTFIGWVMLYDWTVHLREVVSFQGDHGAVTLISKRYTLQAYSQDGLNLSHRASKIVRLVVVYTSTLLGLVAALLFLYGAAIRFRVLGRNLFRFNRVAGSVWVGRIFLCLRGFTAVALLGTSSMELTNDHGLSRFEPRPRSCLASMLVNGEATWLAYVLHDVLAAFVADHSYYAAPVSTCVAFCILVVVDLAAPIVPSMVLTPASACRTRILAKQVVCVDGVVYFGLPGRALLVMAVQVAVVGMVYAVAIGGRWRRTSAPVALLISGASEAFLDVTPQDEHHHSTCFDKVTCVMCGLLTMQAPVDTDTLYMFDIKSWSLLTHTNNTSESPRKRLKHRRHSCVFQAPVFTPKAMPPPPMSPMSLALTDLITTSTTTPRGVMRRHACVGLVFMALSLTSSILYIVATATIMTNDFWWAHFNVTGGTTQAFLGNFFNDQLLLNPIGGVVDGQLDRREYSESVIFGAASTTSPLSVVSSSPMYARAVHYEATTDLAGAICGLRGLDACSVPTMATQWCWLDFRHEFAVANSARRQRRCATQYGENGAVVLEAALRNVDWAAFASCWGEAFDIAFGRELAQTSSGRAWLKSVQVDTMLDVDDEVGVWVHGGGISHFALQFQNFKRLGLVESYTIQNAFGTSFSMPLKVQHGLWQPDKQTSLKLYWTLANDFAAVVSPGFILEGASLISSSANFAYANITARSILIATGVLPSVFSPAYETLEMTLGPFGSIDAFHVACPHSATLLYTAVSNAVKSTIAISRNTEAAFLALDMPMAGFMPCPVAWSRTPRFGGNLLCPTDMDISTAALQSPWTDDSCNAAIDVVYPTPMSFVVASVASRGNNISDACTNVAPGTWTHAQCEATLHQASAFVQTALKPTQTAAFASMAAAAQQDIARLNVSLLQFDASMMASSPPLLRFTLFDSPSSSFDFFAWTFAVEWILGYRQVVSFHGDVASLTLLRAASLSMDAVPNPLDVPLSASSYYRGILVATTLILTVVALLTTAYVVASCGCIEGRNLLELQRVAALVWIGRPLLVLRAVVALMLLSTADLTLVQNDPLGLLTTLEARYLTWYQLGLAATEVVWLVYVVSDVCIPLTRQYTTQYTTKSSIMTSFLVGAVSFVLPAGHRVTVARTCRVTILDLEIECDAGTVYIGSMARFLSLVVLTLVCMAAAFAYERLRHPVHEDARHTASALLAAAAKYHFALNGWKFKDCHYLDLASGVITGLLCVEYGRKFYVLDVKLWRVFVLDVPNELRVPKEHPLYEHVQFAFPLVGNRG